MPAVLLLVGVSLVAGTAVANDAAEAARTYREQHEAAILAEFRDFLSLPNVATDTAAMDRNAAWLTRRLGEAGFDTEVWRGGGAPYVFAEKNFAAATKTVLIYAHFDGQPVDVANWASPPWQPTLRTGALDDGGDVVDWDNATRFDPQWRVYARSAGDDKAPDFGFDVPRTTTGGAVSPSSTAPTSSSPARHGSRRPARSRTSTACSRRSTARSTPSTSVRASRRSPWTSPPAAPAMIGATVLLIWLKPDVHHMIKAVDWTTLVFFLYYQMGWTFLALAIEPLSIIGIAVSFYLGFKNSQSYDRFWEARRIWGSIVNYSRTWGTQVLSLVEDAPEDQRILIYRHLAWINAMRAQLR